MRETLWVPVVAVLGPLIGRFGEARVAMPGGCLLYTSDAADEL